MNIFDTMKGGNINVENNFIFWKKRTKIAIMYCRDKSILDLTISVSYGVTDI